MNGGATIGNDRREEWDSTAKGWRKWDPVIMGWLQPVGEKMLDLARLEEISVVLDVATGSGEPGLSAAKRSWRGAVIGLDISEEMLKTAKEKAAKAQLTNYETRLYDGDKFPFEGNHFDAVISRFGVMFFPDVLGGLSEMVRVLKPGGRLCVAVWGPPNETAEAGFETLKRRLGLPEDRPESRNPYKFSETGKIASLLREARLHNVETLEVQTKRVYSSFARFWEQTFDMNPDIAKASSLAETKTSEDARLEVEKALRPAEGQDGHIEFDSLAWVAHGTK